MPKAVQFDGYGGVDVLELREVDAPAAAPGRVVVAVRATAINPGEASIRDGALAERWPSTFPSGQGSDLAGVVTEAGPGVDGFAPGDEVLGWTDDRAAHAELVAVEADKLVPKPAGVSWEAAGSLHVVGATAWAAVRAVAPQPGEVVVVSGAAGGVGTLAVQLAARAGATVIGLASPDHHDWLRDHGAIPVTYGDGVEDRIRAAGDGRFDALIDTFGGGYVDLAIAMGVAPGRIDTIIDWDAAERVGAKVDGNAVGARPEVLAELADLIDRGELEIPIARTYPLADGARRVPRARAAPRARQARADPLARGRHAAREASQSRSDGISCGAASACGISASSSRSASESRRIETPWSGSAARSTSIASPAPSSPSATIRRYAPGRDDRAKRLQERRVAHPQAELEAREPRLDDLEQRRPDPPALADERARDVDALGGQVLAERGGAERAAELVLPAPDLLDRVRVDRLVRAAVHGPVGLVVAVEVDAADGDAARDRVLPDRGLDHAPPAVDRARAPDVDADDACGHRYSGFG